VVGTCECDDKLSDSIKCGVFLDWLKTGWVLKNDSLHEVSKYVSKQVNK
jgi:hypothetical protein